jgi:hypothetical protein
MTTNFSFGERQTRGNARIRLRPDDYVRFRDAGVLVTDAQRSLPLPFDGRFFTASDWIREQSYFLRRQADFGRSVGSGVGAGLEVTLGEAATALTIAPGHGITPAGELVLLPEEVTVDVGDIARMLSLSQLLGLSGTPRHPARTRSGLFVLALRPVEFTANPVASYPRSLDDPRRLEHGDIVEGVVVTLVPFPDPGSALEGERRRGRVARAVFLDRNGDVGVPEALPLAMVAMRRGAIDWVDPYLVRRELGTDREDVLGFGRSRRAARVAHVHQYHDHLDQILREQGTQAAPFAAAAHFDALPAAGRLPSSAVDLQTLTQTYFPATVDVRMTIVPADELSVLVEEALRLPPIDLTGGLENAPGSELTALEDALDRLSVLVLLPVSTHFGSVRESLPSVHVRALSSAVTGIARRRPGALLEEAFGGKLIPFVHQPASALKVAAELVPWQKALAATDEIWYVRCRTQHTTSIETGQNVPVIGDEFSQERQLVGYLKSAALYETFHHLKTKASAEADLAMVKLLGRPGFAQSKTLVAGPLYELQRKKQLAKTAVATVAQRYQDPDLGRGILRLEQASPAIATSAAARIIGRSLVVAELDRLAAALPDDSVAELAHQIAALVAIENPTAIRELVQARLQEHES